MVVYKLDNNLNGDKILKDIQRLVNQFSQNSQDQTGYLCITIKTIAYDDTSLIPKLEYKGDCLT